MCPFSYTCAIYERLFALCAICGGRVRILFTHMNPLVVNCPCCGQKVAWVSESRYRPFVPNDADKWIWAHGRRRNTQSKEIRKTFRLIRTQTIILTLNNKMRFNKDCPASSPLKRV